MKVSVSAFVLLLTVGLAAANPTPGGGHKGPPGPPKRTVSSISQSCSASQSSIHCCNGSNGSKKSKVSYEGDVYDLQCSQITVEGNESKPVQSICETTVACCIGDGCTAIAN